MAGEGFFGNDFACFDERFFLPDAQFGHFAVEAEGGEVGMPVDLGHELLQFVHRHFVVVGIRVAQLHVGVERFGQARFNLHDGLHVAFGLFVAEARELEHFHHVLLVRFADARRVLVVVDVVFAFAERDAVLVGLEQVFGAAHGVGVHVNGEVAVGAVEHELWNERGEFLLAPEGGNACEVGLNGRVAVLVELRAVHGHVVEVAYFLLREYSPVRGFFSCQPPQAY